MSHLLDVNVLVALAWPPHVHHELAHRWFEKHHEAGWATCPASQAGFVRVSSNAKALRDAVSPREALALLERIVSLEHHRFWNDDINLATTPHVERAKILGYRQITDAHLLAVARSHRGRLVTLDKGLLSLTPRPEHVVLIREST